MIVIIRRLPGSGKSTLAKEKFSRYDHYEADMFFMKDGEYKFDQSKIAEAHKWCQRKVEESLKNNRNVVVSNTFTTKKEISPYLDLQSKYKVILQVITMRDNFESIHSVPEKIIERMKARWEENIFE